MQEGICAILQEINLPSVRVEPFTAEVLEHNELFSSLVHAVSSRNFRLWFVEGVLPHFAPGDRSRWEAALAEEALLRLPVRFAAVDGRTASYEMCSFPVPASKGLVQSVVCVFVPQVSLSVSDHDKLLAEGRASERSRIRNALHKNISQQLLGAAFGCKLLASKIGRLNDDLGKEASELAIILNQAVAELQNLIHSDSNEK
jgi:hypothetical protein